MRSLGLLVIMLAAACHESGDGEFEGFCGDGVKDRDERCDDGNDDDMDACSNSCGVDVPLAVSWEIRTGAGASVACEPNADTARIRIQPYASTGPFGPEEVFIAPCITHMVLVTPTPADVYMVIVELVVAADGRYYAESSPLRVDETTGSLVHAVITVP